MTTVSATEARRRLYALIDEVGQSHQPVQIQGKRGNAVLTDPYQQPPPYEVLVGDLRGACSRRINIQHRLGYQVVEDVRVVKVLRMWSHYD